MTDTPTKKTTEFKFELTDTFGGEANYSWVERNTETLPRGITDRALMRKAKAWAGLTGCRGKTVNLGETLAFYPRGSCTVLFITPSY